MIFVIGIPNDDIEVDIIKLNNLLKDSTIYQQFTNVTFIKLKDNTIIRINNEDLEKYKIEIRNIKLNHLTNEPKFNDSIKPKRRRST